jgi:hypothetical protein
VHGNQNAHWCCFGTNGRFLGKVITGLSQLMENRKWQSILGAKAFVDLFPRGVSLTNPEMLRFFISQGEKRQPQRHRDLVLHYKIQFGKQRYRKAEGKDGNRSSAKAESGKANGNAS